jgi:hypothetical protein
LHNLRDIRKTILEYIDVVEEKLEALLERARDSHPTVRLAFYGRLKEVPEMFEFGTEAQITELLKIGLAERDERVRDAFLQTLFSAIAPDFESLYSLIVLIGLDDEKKSLIQELLREYFKRHSDFHLQCSGILELT